MLLAIYRKPQLLLSSHFSVPFPVSFWPDADARRKYIIWCELAVPPSGDAFLPESAGLVPERCDPGSFLRCPAEPHCQQGCGEQQQHHRDRRKRPRSFVLIVYCLWFSPKGSSAMSQILVQKLGALAHISPLLKSPNTSLQKNAVSLLGNMARTSCLQTAMGKEGALDIIKHVVCM